MAVSDRKSDVSVPPRLHASILQQIGCYAELPQRANCRLLLPPPPPLPFNRHFFTWAWVLFPHVPEENA